MRAQSTAPADDDGAAQPSTSTTIRLFDAHAHLQSPRLAPLLDAVMTAAAYAGVTAIAVNATHEGDWAAVLALAAAAAARAPAWPAVRPSLGIHPWHLRTRTPGWEDRLAAALSAHPGAGVGESGLDRAPKGLAACRDAADAATALATHLDLGKRLGRPVTLHCVRAIGPITDAIAARAPFPAGVVLHAWAGSPEATARLAALGGVFFSVGARQVAAPPPPGQAGVRQPIPAKARAMLASIPPDRLLLETDAPDGFIPGFGVPAGWGSGGGGGVCEEEGAGTTALPPPSPPANQPANLVAVLAAVSEATGRPAAEVAAAACAAGERLFGAG
jgi:TatD DNase family protein